MTAANGVLGVAPCCAAPVCLLMGHCAWHMAAQKDVVHCMFANVHAYSSAAANAVCDVHTG